jgi:chromatin segregation and condensation protein Rec8/ScpA/Scc1 (kleisin family)
LAKFPNYCALASRRLCVKIFLQWSNPNNSVLIFTKSGRKSSANRATSCASSSANSPDRSTFCYLIKQEQANIFDIPIARITDEYLKYIRLMKTLDISVAGDFLVMAATLIEIKSKMLLPKDITEEAEEEMEDPREALVRQLLEHQKFKNAAQMLYERTTVEQAVFPRGKIESDENNSETNATVFDLLSFFRKFSPVTRKKFRWRSSARRFRSPRCSKA